jgi:hypothetical protein
MVPLSQQVEADLLAAAGWLVVPVLTSELRSHAVSGGGGVEAQASFMMQRIGECVEAARPQATGTRMPATADAGADASGLNYRSND